ncbi:MAG: putative drug exporter of the superfamily [Mycobacterium sp.]|nr:putative drug exporter of the superfamily [Mycobacterium sp.]
MLEQIARLATLAPRRIIAIAVLAMIGTAIFGIPVAKSLSAGGFENPNSESQRATNLLANELHQGDLQMLITITSDDGAQSSAARVVAADIVRQLHNSPYVAEVTSPWTAPPSASAGLISKDGKTGLIVAGINGGENEAPKHAKALSDALAHDRDGVTVRAGGDAITYAEVIDQTERDLNLMEAIAIPLSFLVLVWVFGGLVAAALPIVVGGFSVFGSMAVLRAVSLVTQVSIFALNLLVAMGMALAIDYTLLILSRFRDEVADGAEPDKALARTMASAGRTVLFSATTVALSMSTLVLFPMYSLRSFGYVGIAVVAFAAIAAIVVTPALIALLGDRLAGRKHGSKPSIERPIQQTFWYRWAKFAMRRAVPIGLAVVALMLTLGAPFFGVKWGFPDDRVLPTSASARQVGDQLRTDFDDDQARNATVVVSDTARVTPEAMNAYASQLSRVPDVSSVFAPGGTFVAGALVGPPSTATGTNGSTTFLTVASSAPLYSPASTLQLDRLHAVPGPAEGHILIGGTAQTNRDAVSGITSRLPLVLTVIAAITLTLLFFLTGSIVLPLKALVLNVLSLTAAFGALVWIFQEGHLGAFGTTPTGTLVVNVLVQFFCIAFGLSMDYEVFLVSRIREYWLASDRTPADNDESVALGLAHTGRVITAAALIMSISFAALIAAHVSFMRMFGVGLTLAILADATLVRMLLVPALMHMMGQMNWWSPKLLARLHERFGITESRRPPATESADDKRSTSRQASV